MNVDALLEGLMQFAEDFRAGESPVASAVEFVAWPEQDPEKVAWRMRREWMHRGTLPGWCDRPWFCAPHLGRAAQCLSLDGLKEELIHFRLWLGIVVVAEISLLGWIAAAAETTAPRLFALAVGGS